MSHTADNLSVNMVSEMHLVSQRWAMLAVALCVTANNIRPTAGRRCVAQIKPASMWLI